MASSLWAALGYIVILLLISRTHGSGIIGTIRILADNFGHKTVLLNTGTGGFMELHFVDNQADGLRTGQQINVNASFVDMAQRKIDVISWARLASHNNKQATASISTEHRRELWGTPPGTEKVFKSITYIMSICGAGLRTTVEDVRANWFTRLATSGAPSLEGYFEMGYNPDAYKHQIMIIPDFEDGIPCTFAGNSDQGCITSCVSIIKSSTADKLGIITHELGHSLFLAHSAKDGIEYQDTTSAMGSHCCEPACYNAPQTWSLGWADPIAVYNESNLKAGEWKSEAVPPFLKSNTSFVQIYPTWIDLGPEYSLYFSYKLEAGYNAGISPFREDYGSQLLVYTFNASAENAGSYKISIEPDLVAIVPEGNSYYHDKTGISVKVHSVNETLMTISFCRGSCGPGNPRPSPPPPSPSPPSTSPGTCGYTLVQSNTWCASSRGTWGRTSVDDCANYCKTVARSTPPFCFDFNDKIKHCECSSGPDPSQAAENYNSYTYSCASDTTR
eukprot:gene26768-4345_t